MRNSKIILINITRIEISECKESISLESNSGPIMNNKEYKGSPRFSLLVQWKKPYLLPLILTEYQMLEINLHIQ